MRLYLFVSLALVGASADTNGCAAETRGLKSCHVDMPIADTTSMLQVTNFKKAEPDAGLAEEPIEDVSKCPFQTDAVWAAMDTYVEVDFPSFMDSTEARSYGKKLRKIFWKLEGSWLALNKTTSKELKTPDERLGALRDSDYTGLWVKDESCMLAFRGSDSQIDVNMLANAPKGYQRFNETIPGAPNGVQWDTAEFHGLKVHLGVKVELEALLAKIQSDEGFAKIKTACTKGLTLTGHSLGGGTSQLMATLLNKNGDPLGADLTVDRIIGFGPMPFIKDKPAVNDKSDDGCFAGNLYANTAGKDEAGLPKVDPVWQMLTSPPLSYRHVKTTHSLMVAPDEYMVTPCGEDVPYPYTELTVPTTMFPTHMPGSYVKKIGCPKD